MAPGTALRRGDELPAWLEQPQLGRVQTSCARPITTGNTPSSRWRAQKLLEIWETTAGWYRPEVNRAQMNLLDSHDVPRALHTLQGDVAALAALLLLFLQPGAPCVYYGTETGLDGGPDGDHASGPEPACREGFLGTGIGRRI